jgi:gliding-associated putative ABC transporter substrate-binding component GldG
MPSGFRQLADRTRELLQEFKEYGRINIQFQFSKPGAGLEDSAKLYFLDSLARMGIKPYTIQVQAKEGEGNDERQVVPGALISYHGKATAINLLSGQPQTEMDAAIINKVEALLEYKFVSAIQKITSESPPLIGYLFGNGQPLTYNVFDLIQNTLKPSYGFGFVHIDSFPLIPLNFDAIVIVKPTQAFNDRQKLKIDQYIMHGGKVIWMIDNLYAEMDSLRRTKGDFVAFDRGLNLDDQLFKYGVRINKDLVQDLQSDQIPQVVGDYGGQPQIELLTWPYFPLLTSHSDHPIAKNMDNVLSIFPNSIDTIKTPGVKKTVLLSTSSNARKLSTPAIVSFNTLKTEEDMKSFNQKNIPIAVLLEGTFTSLYANRISAAIADTLARLYNQPFRAVSSPNKMIVVSDADIVGNVVTPKEGPRPMGFNQYTQRQYANKDFFLNCIEYVVNPSGILETRSKDFTLRLLDPMKIEDSKATWQIINIGLPILLILIFGLIYQALRQKKYQ